MSAPSTAIRLRTPLFPRSPDEGHRTATPLELFFDLVFVVAIAQASNSFHHAIADNRVLDGVTSFILVFFAIWWAWINFTWFASAYDTDDVAYRLIVFVQLTGALILAAGVTSAFDDNAWGIVIVGYVVMRLAGVIQWLRAANADPNRKPAALRYAFGIVCVQVGWCLMYFAPKGLFYLVFLSMVAIEFLIPIWAERAAPTTWHRGHIVERYGLFTIIVLGESVLASSRAIESTSITKIFDRGLAAIIIGALLIVFSMWWLYFIRNPESLLNTMWRAFGWGYGHYFLFGAAAAVGAGIAISVDQVTGHAEIGVLGASLAVTIPVAIFIITVWVLHYRFWAMTRFEQSLAPLFALAILLTSWTNMAVLLTGILVATLVAIEVLIQARDGEAFEMASGNND